MANCIFAWPNLIDQMGTITPSFSGGSWSTALPLTNLVDPILARVARTLNVTTAATQFDVDLASSAAYARIFAIPRHNMGVDARIRIRGSATAGSFGVAQLLRTETSGGYKIFVLPSFTTTSTKAVSFYLKAPATNPTTSFRLQLYKSNGTPATLLNVTVDIAGGVMTPTASTGTYNGIDTIGDGWFRIRCTSLSAVNTDTHQVEVYPNGSTLTGLDALVYGIMVEDNASHDAYQSGGANLLSDPNTYDFSTWSVGTGTVTVVSDGWAHPGSGGVYNSDWLDVWPVMWPVGVLPWGHPNLWTRKITPNQIGVYRAGFTHVADDAYNARYWRFELDDTTNAAGYLDLARLVISPGYEPSVNFAYGASAGLVSETSFEQSLGGARFYDERPVRKTMVMTFPELPIDESLGVMQEMVRDLRTSRQVYFIFDRDDTFHLYRRSFLGTFREMGALEYAYYGAGGMALAMEEVL